MLLPRRLPRRVRPPPTNDTDPVEPWGTVWASVADVRPTTGKAKPFTGLYGRQYVPMFLSAAKSLADRDTNVNTTAAQR